MAVNSFKPKKYEDFDIVDSNGAAVGRVRVKPSGIAWKSKGSHKWLGLSLKQLDELAAQHGKTQRK